MQSFGKKPSVLSATAVVLRRKRGCCRRGGCFPLARSSLGVGFCRVVLWGLPSAISSTLAAWDIHLIFSSIILIIRPCDVWSFFFISSVIFHVSVGQRNERSDGVTVASKSSSFSG